MLFASKLFPSIARSSARRFKSTAPIEHATEGQGALMAAVGTTFVTYMTADFLSNFLQHPTQKVSDAAVVT